MNTKTIAASSSFSFTSMLGLLFIGLKLTGFIDWSWPWVLSPFWLPWAVFATAVFLTIFVSFVISFIAGLLAR